MLPAVAFASGGDAGFSPRVETGLKYGSKRSIGGAEFWAPLAQGDDRVLYADFRFTFDDREDREVNAGLGYRRIVPLFGYQVVAGGHAWLDRRMTRYDSTFHQVALGAELLSRDWDFRLNAYAPLNDEKYHATPNTGSATPYLSGTGIFYDTAGLLVEEPQPGVDIEVGRRIPLFEGYTEAIRAYAGAYHFSGDQTDDVSGVRARLVADITTDISIGGRFQHDDERGTQAFIEATLRFPLAGKRSFRHEGVRARLDESPERDIDIVTGGRVLDTGLRKPVLAAETGELQRVLHVDNTAAEGGDGSKEKPFHQLKDAEAQLKPYDVVYLHAGDGTTTGQDAGFVIDIPNITLIGSGVDFIYDGGKFTTGTGGNLAGTIIAAATSAPVITNLEDGTGTNDTGIGIFVTADQASISGIALNNTTAGHSIYALNDSGTVWQSVSVSDINVNYTSGIGGEAVRIHSLGEGSVIRNIYVRDVETYRDTASSRGINITAGQRSIIENLEISGTRSYGSIQGFNIVAQSGGYIAQAKLTDVEAHNATTGILIAVQTPNAEVAQQGIGHIRLENVAANHNNANINVSASGNRIARLEFVNVNVDDNNASTGTHGLAISASGTGSIGEVFIDGLNASGNRQHGLRIATAGTAEIGPVSIENSLFTGNGQYGVAIIDGSTTQLDIDMGGGVHGSTGHNSLYSNSVSSPGTYGDLQLDLDGSLTPLPAQYNWWGQAGEVLAGQIRSVGAGVPPAANTGTADTSFALDEDPNS